MHPNTLYTLLPGILQSRVWEVVHNVVVVQEHAHGLPNYAKEEPEHHISHLHRTFRN